MYEGNCTFLIIAIKLLTLLILSLIMSGFVGMHLIFGLTELHKNYRLFYVM